MNNVIGMPHYCFQKRTRLAPGCNTTADGLVQCLNFRYGSAAIFGDQRETVPPVRMIVSACPPGIQVFKRFCGRIPLRAEAGLLI